MNKQRKRAISRGKFDRASDRARCGMRVNAFEALIEGDNPQWIGCYITDGFMYWSEMEFVDFKPAYRCFRKSIKEALK